MGAFANPPWVIALAILVAAAIIGLNGNLVAQQVGGWIGAAGPRAWMLWLTVAPLTAGASLLLAYLTFAPLLEHLFPALAVRAAEAVPALPPPPRPAPVPGVAASFRRIALALELGAADRAVLEHVKRMALPADAELVLMHVAESAASRFLGPESSDQESREDLATLESLAEELRARGLRASVRLGHGDVKDELARMADEERVDLVITGSHGHRLVGDLFFGATTSGLRHRVKCAVLAIRAE
jgi:manganese transport protein